MDAGAGGDLDPGDDGPSVVQPSWYGLGPSEPAVWPQRPSDSLRVGLGGGGYWRWIYPADILLADDGALILVASEVEGFPTESGSRTEGTGARFLRWQPDGTAPITLVGSAAGHISHAGIDRDGRLLLAINPTSFEGPVDANLVRQSPEGWEPLPPLAGLGYLDSADVLLMADDRNRPLVVHLHDSPLPVTRLEGTTWVPIPLPEGVGHCPRGRAFGSVLALECRVPGAGTTFMRLDGDAWTPIATLDAHVRAWQLLDADNVLAVRDLGEGLLETYTGSGTLLAPILLAAPADMQHLLLFSTRGAPVLGIRDATGMTYQVLEGDQWVEAARIDSSYGGAAVLDASGSLHVAFTSGWTPETFVGRVSGGAWQPIGPGTAAGGLAEPEGSVGSSASLSLLNGAPHLTFAEHDDGDAFVDFAVRRWWTGSGWESERAPVAGSVILREVLGTASDPVFVGEVEGAPCVLDPNSGQCEPTPHPIIGVRPDGTPVALERDGERRCVWVASPQWTQVGDCVDLGESRTHATVTLDAAGWPVLLSAELIQWGAWIYPRGDDLRVLRFDGSTWTDVGGPLWPSVMLQSRLAVDGLSRLVLVGLAGEIGSGNMMTAERVGTLHVARLEGDQWVTLGEPLGGPPQIAPAFGHALAFDPLDRPVLAWSADSEQGVEVYVARYDGTWQALSSSMTGGGVSQSDSVSRVLGVAADQRRVCVAWYEAVTYSQGPTVEPKRQLYLRCTDFED